MTRMEDEPRLVSRWTVLAASWSRFNTIALLDHSVRFSAKLARFGRVNDRLDG
jgi:hypothetical protein